MILDGRIGGPALPAMFDTLFEALELLDQFQDGPRDHARMDELVMRLSQVWGAHAWVMLAFIQLRVCLAVRVAGVNVDSFLESIDLRGTGSDPAATQQEGAGVAGGSLMEVSAGAVTLGIATP